MRKRIICLVIMLIPLFTFGQEIIIDFTGTGATTTIDSVEIVNLTNCTSLIVPGDSSVILIPETVNINKVNNNRSSKIECYPNPFNNSIKIQFTLNKNERITLLIFNISGQIIAEHKGLMSEGTHEFEFSSGNSGIFFISITGKDFLITSEIISLEKNTNNAKLTYYRQSNQKFENDYNKSTGTKDFIFTQGDTLKLKGISGNYSTVLTDIPENSKTYTFEFIECTDYSGNNYAVVEIGNQIWMAENLKTTHYSDGTPIPHVISDEDWGSLFYNSSSKAYCYYNNNENGEAEDFGAMYTWAAASNNTSSSSNPSGVQGACPTGWHLPSKSEAEELFNFIGTNNGAELKSSCSGLWITPNIGATNEFGFTALAGGVRLDYWGQFQGKYAAGFWYLATESGNDNSWSFHLRYDNDFGNFSTNNKTLGKSVRCILD